MARIDRRKVLGLGALMAALPGSGLGAQPPKTQSGQPLNITVTTAAPPPDVSLVLGSRSAKATPVRSGTTHTGGGNIDVQQPSPDTIVLTMTGVAVAYGGPCGAASASQVFDLVQQFEVSFDKPGVRSAKLTVEGRLIGLLRSHKHGSAEVSANATVSRGTGSVVTLLMPAHAVAGNESLSINDREASDGANIAAGKFTLTQSFQVSAAMPRCALPSKAPSAEFAPDPALDPLWISPKEPFKGAKKTDLGFQVTIRVAGT